MLRKMLSLGALAMVAVTFGIANAVAKPAQPPKAAHGTPAYTDGFSDGRG
jgi:hypothetical protein